MESQNLLLALTLGKLDELRVLAERIESTEKGENDAPLAF